MAVVTMTDVTMLSSSGSNVAGVNSAVGQLSPVVTYAWSPRNVWDKLKIPDKLHEHT